MQPATKRPQRTKRIESKICFFIVLKFRLRIEILKFVRPAENPIFTFSTKLDRSGIMLICR